MATRNFSPQIMFQRMAAEHRPSCAFSGQSREQFDAWKAQTLPKVLATLGDSPAAVAPNAELVAEWPHDGLRKQRWLIDVAPHISASFQVNIPPDIQPGQKRPAILCCHGHGKFGKDPVMGNNAYAEVRESIASCNYSYGHQMAKAGFVTFAIDWIGFGERNDSRKPNHHNQAGGRDWCNIYYLHATMLGMTSLSINLAHGRAATDFACSLPYVDAGRLGVMGLSGGGTMTLWSTLCDARFRACEIICYSDLWSDFGIRDTNYCGMQVAPGLYKLVDLPDLQGLLAPRPLLVDIGVNDACFLLDSAMACYRKVEKIYGAAGAEDRLELDLHPGPHGWGGNKSIAFFQKHLA